MSAQKAIRYSENLSLRRVKTTGFGEIEVQLVISPARFARLRIRRNPARDINMRISTLGLSNILYCVSFHMATRLTHLSQARGGTEVIDIELRSGRWWASCLFEWNLFGESKIDAWFLTRLKLGLIFFSKAGPTCVLFNRWSTCGNSNKTLWEKCMQLLYLPKAWGFSA